MRKVENITGLVYEVDWSKTISGEALLSLFVCLFGIQTLDAIIEVSISRRPSKQAMYLFYSGFR